MNTHAAARLTTPATCDTGSWIVDSSMTRDAGRQLAQHRLLDLRHDERHVGLPDQRELLVALRARRERGAARALERRQPLLAQEVQVDRVEHDQRVRRGLAHRVDVPRGDVVARQHDHVEFAPARDSSSATERTYGWNSTSTPRCCQRRHVRLAMLEVVGDERHLASAATWRSRRSPACAPSPHPGRASACTRRSPACAASPSGRARTRRGSPFGWCDASAADHFVANAVRLIAWCRLMPCADVGPRRLPFEMHDARSGLVEHPETRGAQRECEVRVLVIGRCVPRIESAELRRRAHAGGRDTRPSSNRRRARSCIPAASGSSSRPKFHALPSRHTIAARLLQPPVGIDAASRRRARHPDARGTRRAARRASPAVTSVSLFRKTSVSPRASAAPRLQVPMKPRFRSLRSKRTPRHVRERARQAARGDASSTTITSYSPPVCRRDARKAAIGQQRLPERRNHDRHRRRGRRAQRQRRDGAFQPIGRRFRRPESLASHEAFRAPARRAHAHRRCAGSSRAVPT